MKEGMNNGKVLSAVKDVERSRSFRNLREVREIEEVDEAEYSEGYSKILVLTEKEKYPEVMTRIINIVSRVGKGCELSFAGFAI